MTIKISIITATKNCISTINDALHSLDIQIYSTLEFIWVDGLSDDGTYQFLLSKFNKNMGKLISEKDSGIYDALNKGVILSTGDVIGFLHADDVLFNEDVLARIAFEFENNNADVVYGDLLYVENSNLTKIVRNWKSELFQPNLLIKGWMPPHPTLYLKKELFVQLNGFNADYKIAADYDFILRLFSIPNINIKYIPQVIVKMRTGGASNKSLRNLILKSYEDYCSIKKNSIGGMLTLFRKNIGKICQFIFNK